MPIDEMKYFSYRNVSKNHYADYALPNYIRNNLPDKLHGKILDIGCGFGQILIQIKKLGYLNIKGVDISREAVAYCKEKELDVQLIQGLSDYILSEEQHYDLIIMTHVLEHIDKQEIISTLKLIKNRLLEQDGAFLVVVPNAQSNTGCYWAYEDFTHQTLFTAGSLYYVLKAAGFDNIEFLDPEGLQDSTPIVRIIKKILLNIYYANKLFWNFATTSSYHKPSPIIFTYDVKVLAR